MSGGFFVSNLHDLMFSHPFSSGAPGKYAAAIVFACAIGSAHALTWETPSRELSLDLGTAEVAVEFPYKNETDSPISITHIKSGCECSAIERPEAPIPAGGKGVLTVRYNPGTTPGVRVVPIEVTTDQPKTAAARLSIKATLEPVLKLDPVLLRWTRGDAADAQSTTIAGTGRAPIDSLKLVAPPDTVVASLTPGKEAEQWTLSVAPASTEKTLTVRVEVQAEVRGQTVTQSVWVVVR